jgi:ketosteroid isomerase-like protein
VAGVKFHISFQLKLGGTKMLSKKRNKMLAKKCLLVGIFTVLSVSLAISAQPVHPTTGEPLVIDCLRGTPDAIDGDLSDWNLEAMTPAVLDAVEQLSSGQDIWENVGDCGGAFYMLWDDENIYIAAVVTDDKLSMNKTDGDIWNSDCIEVLFSTTDARADHSWSNPTIHYQYGFNANNQTWNWCNMDGPGQSVPDYLQAASSITADGYICEVSIPHSEITPLDWSVGSIIGFHPCIDDTDIDNGDTEYQMSWTGLPAHDQSLGFGHMVLSGDPVPAPDGWQSQDIGTTGGSAEESDGTWVISADGTDIWGNSDQFHYVYRELTGDAVIEARVVDNGEGSNAWAKGGVMIRQSLDGDSINVSGFITGGSGDGGQFQWRSVQGDSSSSNRTLTGIAPPYYVRLVREGNTFTVFLSPDGVEWAQQGAPPAVIEMTDPVLIGLAVTSHQDGEVRTFTFDNVRVVSPDVIAIEEVLNQYAVYANAGDLESWLSLHANDVVKMPPDAPAIFGIEDLRANFTPAFENFNTSCVLYPEEAHVDGDLGYARGNYSISITPKAGGETISLMPDGKYLTICKRQADGSWKISHDCYNSNVPPAPPPEE